MRFFTACCAYLSYLVISCAEVKGQEVKLMLPVGQTEAVAFIRFSPDGRFVLTASQFDNIVNIWETASARLVLRIGNITEEIRQPGFSADGRHILVIYKDKKVRSWSVADGKEVLPVGKTDESILVTGSKEHRSPNDHINVAMNGSDVLVTDSLHSGKTIELKGHTKAVTDYKLSLSGKLLATSSNDSTIRIWRVTDGKQVSVLNTGNYFKKRTWVFNTDETRLVCYESDYIRVYDISRGHLVADIQKDKIRNGYEVIDFSADGRYMAWGKDLVVKIIDLSSGATSYLQSHSDKLNTVQYDPSGKLLLSASWDKYPRVWDVKEGKVLRAFKNRSDRSLIGEATIAAFDRSASYVFSYNVFRSKSAKLWDVATGQVSTHHNDFNDETNTGAVFSYNGRYMLSWGNKEVTIINVSDGKVIAVLPGTASPVQAAIFSPDDQYMALSMIDNSIQLWSFADKRRIAVLPGKAGIDHPFCFNGNSKYIAAISADTSVTVWQTSDGKMVSAIRTDHTKPVFYLQFSPSGEQVFTASHDETFKVWQTDNGLLIKTITGHKGHFKFSRNFDLAKVIFSADNKYVFTSSGAGMTKKWDAKNFHVLGSVDNGGFLQDISKDNKRLVTIDNAIVRFYNADNMELELSYLPVDSDDYLVLDKYNRYDGTEAARRMLYFTCGTEIIELGQVKDQLWVPGLAERINNGETINAKILAELGVCGLTPIVTDISNKESEYSFRILSRRGGLGETVVFVNGIEAKKYQPRQLQKSGDTFLLNIKRTELSSWFIPGAANRVMVKAYIAGNEISSRSIIADDEQDNKTSAPPSLYAVMIGVSDYGGDELDLKYAAKDAIDISNAVAASARKLLNNDGKEHVFIYNLNTDKGNSRLPVKDSIRTVLNDIGKKATPNDILLIFFAGHGMVGGEGDKQFYFLTANASKSSAADAVANVGISTAELAEWMKPQDMKAQKRIMIFDACNSGQAIRDFVSMGANDQKYITARSDEKGQQVKAIEKLNEKSGLFILAASASNQKAYEMSRYSQGVLTYSLLKTIKQQPDILENGKYLDVSRWFNAAEKTVSELSKENGVRQQPQIVTNTNFAIGVVDEEVLAGIVLPQEKPLFAASNLQNMDESIAADDLELNRLLDSNLSALAARGGTSPIVFISNGRTADAYMLSGRYEVKDNNITVRINVRRGKNVKRFELSGTVDQLDSLAAAIAEEAVRIIK
ncbi:MAG: caspase family protein [Chitinophagaceae bacterium]|nr:caspase family protein [Chitinophagaceae bacterium]